MSIDHSPYDVTKACTFNGPNLHSASSNDTILFKFIGDFILLLFEIWYWNCKVIIEKSEWMTWLHLFTLWDKKNKLKCNPGRPPYDYMFQGTFEQARCEAARQEKELLVNLPSIFANYTLNCNTWLSRNTWGDKFVKALVGISFVHWQVYDDTKAGDDEGPHLLQRHGSRSIIYSNSQP